MDFIYKKGAPLAVCVPPKSGCTSFKFWMLALAGDAKKDHPGDIHNTKWDKVPARVPKIAIHRDGPERIRSAWQMFGSGICSLEDLVYNYTKVRHHTRSFRYHTEQQLAFLGRDPKKFDAVFRLEEPEHLAAWLEAKGIEAPPLPHRNRLHAQHQLADDMRKHLLETVLVKDGAIGWGVDNDFDFSP